MTLTATKANGFAHADLGAFSKFLADGPGEKISKQFLRDVLGLTGVEMSITSYPPGVCMPFFHSHKQNEEVYLVLKGSGQMQLDDKLIDLSEGSIVRVDSSVSRNLKCGPDEDIVFLCIQAKTDSLEQCNKGDGKRENTAPLWE